FHFAWRESSPAVVQQRGCRSSEAECHSCSGAEAADVAAKVSRAFDEPAHPLCRIARAVSQADRRAAIGSGARQIESGGGAGIGQRQPVFAFGLVDGLEPAVSCEAAAEPRPDACAGLAAQPVRLLAGEGSAEPIEVVEGNVRVLDRYGGLDEEPLPAEAVGRLEPAAPAVTRGRGGKADRPVSDIGPEPLILYQAAKREAARAEPAVGTHVGRFVVDRQRSGGEVEIAVRIAGGEAEHRVRTAEQIDTGLHPPRRLVGSEVVASRLAERGGVKRQVALLVEDIAVEPDRAGNARLLVGRPAARTKVYCDRVVAGVENFASGSGQHSCAQGRRAGGAVEREVVRGRVEDQSVVGKAGRGRRQSESAGRTPGAGIDHYRPFDKRARPGDPYRGAPHRSAADHETIRGRARTHVDAERSGSGSYVAAGKRKDTVRRTIAQVDQTAVGEAFQAGEGHGSLDAKRAAVDQQVSPSAELRCARSLESAGVGEGIVASCQVHPAAQRAAWPDRHRGWATVGVQCGPVAAGERVADGNGRAGARGDIDANLRSADGAPARVVTLTVQPLEAAIPVPAAEAIGPRAVTFTAAQPVASALMPLLPGPETVIGPTRMVWSPRPGVTSIAFEPGPAVSIAPTPIVTGPSSPITIIPGESEPPVFTVPPPTLIGPVPSISTPGESSPPVSMTSKSTSIGPSPPSTTIAGESSPSVSTVPKSASTGPGVSMAAPGESSPSVSTSVPPGAPGVPPVGAPGPPGVPPSSLPMTTPQAPVPSVAQAVGSVMRVMAGAEAPSVLTASRFATICPGTSTSTPAA